jgi:TolB-like protein/Tfp pilus assembly protein PilF
MSFFAELKRRNVVRVGIAYVLIAWVLLQAADFGLDLIDAPNWVIQALFLLAAIGLPAVLIFSWIFEMTPEGLKLDSEVDRSASVTPETGRKLDRVIIGVLALVVILLVSERFFGERPGAPPRQAQDSTSVTGGEAVDKSIAVLPFTDLSETQDQGWFADGLAEEILNALVRVPDLKVAARTTSFQYKGTEKSLTLIGEELGVAHVLEGSVRRSGDRLRVTAQLIRANDGFHVWSQNYDRDEADMISIQEDLARSIAQALETTMDPAALEEMARVGTSSIEAYRAYLQGIETRQVAFATQENSDAFRNAYALFEKARRIDPEFSDAHARAAEYWKLELIPSRTDGGTSGATPLVALSEYNERIGRAIETARSEPDRLFSQADRAMVDLRLQEASRLFQAYVDQRPNDKEEWAQLMRVADMLGDAETQRAVLQHWQEYAVTDAYSASAFTNSAWRVIDPGEAADIALPWLQRWPTSTTLLYQLHRTLLWAGRNDEAALMARRYLALVPGGQPVLEARQACATGDRATAEAMLNRFDNDTVQALSNIWLIHSMLGNRREATETLDTLTDSGVPYMLASFLGYRQFDPRPYPELMAVLEREGVVLPDVQEPPYACPPPEETSIAVLPFVNTSADPENEFFSDGVSEEILNVLARVPELKVAARTSSFSYKGQNEKVGVIAEELGVNHVLEGSVRKVGNQVRVTAQLIQASDGFHLWSETYDRELDNIFAIQDDIAQQIAEAMRVSLVEESQPVGNLTGTTSLAAYEHYLRGIGLWHERTAVSLRSARDAFEAAIAEDEEFAKAHSGLALTWAVWAGYMDSDHRETRTLASQHAERALQLDPGNFEAHAALGQVAAGDPDDWEDVVKHYDTAIELNPSFATAYQWYGRFRQFRGDHDSARALFERALALDPRSRIAKTNLAWGFISAGDLAQATRHMNEALEQYPDFPDALSGIVVLGTVNGTCDEVGMAARKLVRVLRKSYDRADRYVALCEAGSGPEAEAVLQEMLDWGEFRYADSESPHLLYDIDFWILATELGDFEAATGALRGMDERWAPGDFGWMQNDQRPAAIRFNCTETARSLYASKGAPPPSKPLRCPG